MMPYSFEDHAIKTLRVAGLRITMPRVQVIRAFEDAEGPLAAYAIHEKIVAAGGRTDVVSVYRILKNLVDAGLILRVGLLDGYIKREPECEQSPDAVVAICGDRAQEECWAGTTEAVREIAAEMYPGREIEEVRVEVRFKGQEVMNAVLLLRRSAS